LFISRYSLKISTLTLFFVILGNGRGFSQEFYPTSVDYEVSLEVKRNNQNLEVHLFIENKGDPVLLAGANFRVSIENYSRESKTPVLLNQFTLIDSLTGPWDSKSNPDFDPLTAGFKEETGVFSININSAETLSPIYLFENISGKPIPAEFGSFGYPIPNTKTRIAAFTLPVSQSGGAINLNWFNYNLIAGPEYYEISDFGNFINQSFPLEKVKISLDQERPICGDESFTALSNIAVDNHWYFKNNSGDTLPLINNSGDHTIIVNGLEVGDSLILLNKNGFISQSDTLVEVFSSPKGIEVFGINLPERVVTGPGVPVVLNADFAPTNFSGTEFSWSPPDGLNRTDGEAVIANPKQSTQYTVVATNEFCEISATVNVVVQQYVSVRPKVFLQGAYNTQTGEMKIQRETLLRTQFNSITGAADQIMNSGEVPNNAVEILWITLYKDPNEPPLSIVPAWLLADGTVLDFETGTKDFVELYTDEIFQGDELYVEVKTQNHLGAFYFRKVSLTKRPTRLDYTFPNYVIENATISNGGRTQLIAGDLNDDGKIDSQDAQLLNSDLGSLNIYSKSDINLDGKIDTQDQNLINMNITKSYKKPIPD
jgi:hypothetical protein